MKITEDGLIQYICGDLPEDKAAEVEVALSNDAELMSRKEALLKLNQRILDFGRAEFRKQEEEAGITDEKIDQKFRELKGLIERKIHPPVIRWRVWSVVSAAAMIILVVSLCVTQPVSLKKVQVALHLSEKQEAHTSVARKPAERNSNPVVESLETEEPIGAPCCAPAVELQEEPTAQSRDMKSPPPEPDSTVCEVPQNLRKDRQKHSHSQGSPSYGGSFYGGMQLPGPPPATPHHGGEPCAFMPPPLPPSVKIQEASKETSEESAPKQHFVVCCAPCVSRMKGLLLLDSGVDREILKVAVPGDVIILVKAESVGIFAEFGTFAELREILKELDDDVFVRIVLRKPDTTDTWEESVPVWWLRSLEPGVHAEDYQVMGEDN